VTVTRPDLTQIFAGHAVEAVDALAVIASGDQQLIKRSPIVSPVEIEANALPQFRFLNFAPPPLVENVLIAGKNGFDAEDDAAITGQRALLEQ